MYKKSLDKLNNTLLKLHKIFDFHTFFLNNEEKLLILWKLTCVL